MLRGYYRESTTVRKYLLTELRVVGKGVTPQPSPRQGNRWLFSAGGLTLGLSKLQRCAHPSHDRYHDYRSGSVFLNDMHVLHLAAAKWHWSNPQIFGKPPSPRCQSTAFWLPNGQPSTSQLAALSFHLSALSTDHISHISHISALSVSSLEIAPW